MSEYRMETGWEKVWTVIIGAVIALFILAIGGMIGNDDRRGRHGHQCVEMLIALDSIPQAVIDHCTEVEE